MATSPVSLPSRLPWADTSIAEGYELDLSGLYRVNSRGEQQKVAGPVWPKAYTENPSQGTFGFVVAWKDRRGQIRERAFPFRLLHEPTKALAQLLANEGLAIVPRQERALIDYLGVDRESIPWIHSVDQVGWLDSPEGRLIFVLPDQVIPANSEQRVIFQPEQGSPTVTVMGARGTLEHWNQRVVSFCRDNPILIFALCCGFAGTLLKSAQLENGGFHLYGRSSQGKTTAAQVAASVLGCGADPADSPQNSRVNRWLSTHNALEAIIAAHNDSTLILDEIQTCDDRNFGNMIYALIGGAGKQAMRRNRSLREQRRWRTIVLSTGEISVRQKIENDRKTAYAGQLLRLVDIPIDHGIIVNTHGRAPSDFAQELKTNCACYYGVAGRHFIEALIENFETRYALSAVVRERLDVVTREIAPKDCEPEQRRALRRFALLIVVGELAVKYKSLQLEAYQIRSAVETVIRYWLTDAAQIPDVIRGVLSVQDFILRHGESRFRDTYDSDGKYPIRDLAGYRSKANNESLYLFNPAAFAEACGGFNPLDVGRQLAELGLLFTHESQHLTSKHIVDGDRIRFYAVRRRILEFDLSDRGKRGDGAIIQESSN